MSNSDITLEKRISLADNGDIEEQKYVGVYLATVSNNLPEGIKWLEKAALKNDNEAMYLLGKIHYYKLHDNKTAFHWFNKAADNKSIPGMVDAAFCYLAGIGTEKNIAKSIELYEKAFALGSVAACHALGVVNSFIEGVEPNYPVAISYYEKAVELGYADSAYLLGVMYAYGIGNSQNIEQAINYLEKSAELGKPYSFLVLGNMYLQKLTGLDDIEKACQYYFSGMEAGIVDCAEVLGHLYNESPYIETDYSLAYDFYVKAAELNSAEGAFMASSLLIRGHGVKKDYRLARKYLIQALNLGHEKAATFLNMLNEIDGGNGAVATSNNTHTGVTLNSSYSESATEINAQFEAEKRAKREATRSIYRAAGAMSGSGSFEDYDMGAVIGPDGKPSFIDADSGIIIGSDGSISAHNYKYGTTYNCKTGDILVYDNRLDATLNLSEGNIKLNLDGFTI